MGANVAVKTKVVTMIMVLESQSILRDSTRGRSPSWKAKELGLSSVVSRPVERGLPPQVFMEME